MNYPPPLPPKNNPKQTNKNPQNTQTKTKETKTNKPTEIAENETDAS